MEIRTGRLSLRTFVASDWRDLLEIAIDKAASRYAIYDHQFPTSETEVKQVTDWFATRTDFLAVCQPSIGKVIGFIRLGGENPGERELGYTLHSSYWSEGYATEACTAVIDLAFSNPGVARIRSGTAKVNTPSVRLLRSLGFEEVAKAPASFANDAQGNPVRFIGVSYLLTRDAWTRKRRASV